MIFDTRIKYNGVRVRLRGATFRRFQNVRVLEAGLVAVKDRLSRGIASDGAKAAPLQKGYARRKSKLTGRAAKRDLNFTGEFLRELKVRYADDSMAAAYSYGRLGRLKARRYWELLQFADSDQEAMRDAAGRIFREEVAPEAFASFRLRGQGYRAQSRFRQSKAAR